MLWVWLGFGGGFKSIIPYQLSNGGDGLELWWNLDWSRNMCFEPFMAVGLSLGRALGELKRT